MADERDGRGATEVGELDLDGDSPDLEATMREAVEAVEGVESGSRDVLDALPAVVEPAVHESGSEQVRREAEELRERLMRTLADFDNLRKRTERERQELRRYSLFEVMREFVTVVDNLERALAASGPSADLKTGVEMILRQMRDLLRRHGVAELEALGRPFDPSEHEAVSRVEDPGVSVPTVVEELQRGYRMHDRLLRPAMVRVAVPASA